LKVAVRGRQRATADALVALGASLEPPPLPATPRLVRPFEAPFTSSRSSPLPLTSPLPSSPPTLAASSSSPLPFSSPRSPSAYAGSRSPESPPGSPPKLPAPGKRRQSRGKKPVAEAGSSLAHGEPAEGVREPQSLAGATLEDYARRTGDSDATGGSTAAVVG
jgi:hypothetical protein